MGDPIYFPEPYCSSETKHKVSIVIHKDYGLTGGGWGDGYMGMWIGPGATADHWGLAHEFAHALQATAKGLDCSDGPNYCGWIHESHANFMAHQLAEYVDNVHCTEMLENMPHVYLGSTRDRYCNWQFMEYLKDKYGYKAVNEIWTLKPASNDPFSKIATSRGWTTSQLNDFFGEWAMHNIAWDYKVSGTAFRKTFGPITDKSVPERRLRITELEPLDPADTSNRRFYSPYLWAPQRWGYNVVRLYPDPTASSVTITFRGVVQQGANSDWRWGVVATNQNLEDPRYSSLQRGSDRQLEFCIKHGDLLWLVVVATPSIQQHIEWDQEYATIYRYPYMVQLAGAWPEGFRNGKRDDCPTGTVVHSNGGGCAISSVPESVYVGPDAMVLGGAVTGNSRIEDHAQIVDGNVKDGVVTGLAILEKGFKVSDSARAQTVFYPLGFFEPNQEISGTAELYGDVEYRGAKANRTTAACSGFVDDSSKCPSAITDVTVAPPYHWRP
jgi:hypothetical protein